MGTFCLLCSRGYTSTDRNTTLSSYSSTSFFIYTTAPGGSDNVLGKLPPPDLDFVISHRNNSDCFIPVSHLCGVQVNSLLGSSFFLKRKSLGQLSTAPAHHKISYVVYTDSQEFCGTLVKRIYLWEKRTHKVCRGSFKIIFSYIKHTEPCRNKNPTHVPTRVCFHFFSHSTDPIYDWNSYTPFLSYLFSCFANKVHMWNKKRDWEDLWKISTSSSYRFKNFLKSLQLEVNFPHISNSNSSMLQGYHWSIKWRAVLW